MDLPSYIRSVGVERFAEQFGESRRAVRGWMYGERLPRKETAAKIVKGAGGKVTWASIYGSNFRPVRRPLSS
jgi:hypothetical protein